MDRLKKVPGPDELIAVGSKPSRRKTLTELVAGACERLCTHLAFHTLDYPEHAYKSTYYLACISHVHEIMSTPAPTLAMSAGM